MLFRNELFRGRFLNPEYLGHNERFTVESVMQQRKLVRDMAQSTYGRVVAVEPDVSPTTAVGKDFCLAKNELDSILFRRGRHFDRQVEFMEISGRHLGLLVGELRDDERDVKTIRHWIDNYIVMYQLENKLHGYAQNTPKPEPEKNYDDLAVVCLTVFALAPVLVLPFVLGL
ncbi:hypothetical protein PG984_015484 [Apiospora sp. TS-2023a]